VPNATVPTPASAGITAFRLPGVKVGAVPVCRCQVIDVTVASENTVRSPPVPRLKFTAPPGSCARIFFEIASIDCVVKTLAPAMSFGVRPPAIAIGSASSSALR